MANTNLGTQVSLPTSKLPAGYTVVNVAFTNQEYTSEILELSVLKATVESATPATTLTDIITNATIGINKQVTDLVAARLTDGVTIYTNLLDIKTNLGFSSDFYKNVVPSYKVKVQYFYKTT